MKIVIKQLATHKNSSIDAYIDITHIYYSQLDYFEIDANAIISVPTIEFKRAKQIRLHSFVEKCLLKSSHKSAF